MKCLATDKKITNDDLLEVRVAGTRVTVVSGDVFAKAKTIRLTLTRPDPDSPFTGESYQCVASFE